MTEDRMMELGSYCESFLAHPTFQDLCAEFDKSTVQSMLATKPTDADDREHMYFTFQGAQQFIGFMQQLVQAKDKLIAADDEQDD